MLPIFVAVVLFFALLIAYPWPVLTLGTLAYLVSLPLGWLSYREHERKDTVAAEKAELADALALAASVADAAVQPHDRHPGDEFERERPPRLN